MKGTKSVGDLYWSMQPQFLGTVVREKDGKRLALVVVGPVGEWSVGALEVDAETQTIQGILDTHAHKFLGNYKSASEAFTAAESFAALWLRGPNKTTQAKVCGCEEIEKRAKKRPRRG